MGRVILLTGERGVGKTTVCREVIRIAQRRGYTCAGLLTLAEGKTRYVLDAGTGRRRRLTQPGDGRGGVVLGRFRFDQGTLGWAERVLSGAVPCDLLVVDEIGPLEMERGKGWIAAFDILRAGEYEVALLVVRPELLAEARDRLAGCSLEVLTVTRKNRTRLVDDLVAVVERQA